MQDNEGQGGFCRTISTLNEGPCRKIKKKHQNTGEYSVENTGYQYIHI